jgi:protein TonB
MRRIVMTEAGFFAQKRNSPSSLALVIALHGGLIAAVMLIKSPQFIRELRVPTVITNIPINPDPPVNPPPPQAQPQQPRNSQIDRVDREVETPVDTGVRVDNRGENVIRVAENTGTGDVVLPPPPPPPFRRAADFDPRYANALQPPYPAIEERAQRDGFVRVRVTIGPDGRVTAVERLTATSDAFWRATEQHALRRWRFRPATLDGRPVQDSKVVTLNFRIADL